MRDVWIKFYKNGALSGVLDYEEVACRISKVSLKLKEAGVQKQDRVVVMMSNSIEAIIYYLALKEIKAIAVPLSPKESHTKLTYIIENCNPKLIINKSGDFKIIPNKDTVNLNREIQTIIYTSGTTGNPKGVCLSWHEWEENAESLIKHHGFTKDTILATPLPIFHCNAHGLGMFTTYIAKCTLILFDNVPPNFLNILNEEKVNVASVVPTILFNLIKDNPRHKFDPEFKYFLTAAAPLSSSLLSELLDNWNVKIVQGFGLSESVNFSCTLPVDIKVPSDLYKKIMYPYPSVGVEIPNVKVTLLNTDKENKTGEILIKSPSNCLGYWGDKLGKQEEIYSGDIAYYRIIEGRRYFYLKGRKKELINRGGEKIYPLELEAEIRSLGFDKIFHILSIPDEKYGEEIAMAVIEPFDYSILYKLPYYRRPKKVYKFKEVFTTSTGKVKRIEMGQYCSKGYKKVEILWQNEYVKY